MCLFNPPEGEHRSKKATKRWYETQEEAQRREDGENGGPWSGPSGWQGPSGWRRFQSEGARLLLGGHPIRWFRWVFQDLDRHQADCRWRCPPKTSGHLVTRGPGPTTGTV